MIKVIIMKTQNYCGRYVLLIFLVAVRIGNGQNINKSENENNSSANEDSVVYYNVGVDMGIINPEKYTLESFQRDDQNIFRHTYREFLALNQSEPVSYDDWLILNNFGVLPDTQESLYQRKISKRSTADNKRAFMNTVRTGDILITGRGVGGLIGHAAIMTSNYWVLEMPGGAGFDKGIPSNNRQIGKDKWFDEHASDWTTVYRCPDGDAARSAARWADHTFYNPSGGVTKTKHITYKLNTDIWSVDPSYCSKLVIQAYYFGTGNKSVIKNLSLIGRIIVPSTIPSYFLSPYKLVNKGRY